MINQTLYTPCRWLPRVLLLAMLMVTLGACSKEGTPETTPDFSKVIFQVNSLKKDPVLYALKVGDYMVEDSLLMGRELTSAVETSAAGQRLLITELIGNTVLLDTMIVIPALGTRYTIYQVDTAANARPLFIAGGQQGNDIPVDTFMQAYYLNDPRYPAVIDVKVFALRSDGTSALVHSFDDLRQGQFTEFIPLAIQTVHKIEVRTADGELIPRLAPFNPDTGTGGLGEARCDFTASNYQVSNFTSRIFGANVIFSLRCMFQY